MEDLLGKKIENYKIESILGRGGMGIVYRAFDEKLDRYVAIKVLSVKALDKERFIERFKREAKNHAQLSHPNIVTVFGFIEYESLLGIVMEYVEGESLERVLFKHSRLHVYDVVYIMRQVLEGIGYAHAKAFVHRDIKPSNIILNSEGTVKIMDFGISKSLVDKSMTSTGSKVGTVYYMSPEQIKGDDVNHLTDIYAIGCTIYEMLYGKPPFYADSEYDIMDGHLKQEHKKLSEIMPGLPPTIDEIINKCLKKNPDERYHYCADIVEKLHELDDYMKDVKSNYFIRTKKDPRKTKIFSIAATSTVVIVLAALFYFVFVQVGELLDSDIVDKFKEYSVQSIISGEDNPIESLNLVTLSKGTDHAINSLSFITEEFAIAIGDSGTLIKTHDNSETWETVNLNESANLYDIHSFTNGNAIIVGSASTIIKTTDFFVNFESLRLSKDYNLRTIEFMDEFKGFIVGSQGIILRSTDSGESWTYLNSGTEETLFDIDFIDEQTGFAVGWNGTIVRTEDGGTTWEVMQPLTNKYLRAVDFWDDKKGLICGGAGTVLHTSNGGENWELVEVNGLVGFNDIKFLSDELAIVVGAKGNILFSENSGKTWNKFDSKKYTKFNKIEISTDGNVSIAGVRGTILRLNLKMKE